MGGQTQQRDQLLFVFDVGGVFIELNADRRRTALEAGGRWSGGSAPDAGLAEANMLFRLGRISESDYLDRVQHIYGLTIEQVLAAETALLSGVLEEMASYVRQLRVAHRVVCLSNTQAIHWRHIIEELLGPEFFDACYLSHEMGMEKPAEDIYLAVQERENVSADQIIFVDDTLDNIHTSRCLGWNSIYHTSAAETISHIEQVLRQPTAAHQL
ncbi:HAD-IA family hydrolase [Rhizobium lemnae]|uniref:HAD-IA family hydrolase n=1 Tax=Rhizobium lemnae TaxID=1214924 RepID=A0ABV8EBI9_9HYPH|nr:HAD-IA family hydrolase [Rhizobium lemnae]MCJ8507435.1 HAD-IA family hydrolase [Rhizobium lemnae]